MSANATDVPHFDVDTTLAAALTLLDRDGYDESSLCGVAEELGAANTSIYWCVKEGLIRTADGRDVALVTQTQLVL